MPSMRRTRKLRRIKLPTCDKLIKLEPKRAAAQEFYDFLMEEGYVLAKYQHRGRSEDEAVLCPMNPSPHELLAKFLGVDQNEMERERRKLLDALRED